MSSSNPFQPINLGDTVRPIAIEKFKGAKGSTEVVSVLSRKINAATVHYALGAGYFFCFKGACCQNLGLPQIRYIVPILVYNVVKFPREYGAPLLVKYLSLGKDAYESDLLVKEQISGDVTKIDLAITCTDEKYQKLKFDHIGPARWRTDKDMVALTTTLFKEYQALIGLSVARSIDEEAFLKVMSESPDGGDSRGGDRRPSRPAPSHSTPHVGSPPAYAALPAPVPAGDSLDLDPVTTTTAPGLTETASSVPGSDINFDDLLDGGPAK